MTQALRIVFVALFVFAAIPAFAQAGGEVVDVKVTHYESTLGRKAPPDLITLMLRVVDEHGHEFQGTIHPRRIRGTLINKKVPSKLGCALESVACR